MPRLQCTHTFLAVCFLLSFVSTVHFRRHVISSLRTKEHFGFFFHFTELFSFVLPIDILPKRDQKKKNVKKWKRIRGFRLSWAQRIFRYINDDVSRQFLMLFSMSLSALYLRICVCFFLLLLFNRWWHYTRVPL